MMRQYVSEFINVLFVIVESFTPQIGLLEFNSAIKREFSHTILMTPYVIWNNYLMEFAYYTF
jgi:hypothetical protein